MSVASEASSDLPGFNTIRREFQTKEDRVLANQLQEQEYEDHFNSNVQLRRTARYDSSVATVLQKEEDKQYEELLKQKRLKEEHDRRVAQRMHEETSKEIQRQREMEEETARIAMSMQDEEVARTIQEKEDHKYMKQKHREDMDAKLARQVSIEEQRRMLKQKQQREHERVLSEQLIQRMQLEGKSPKPDEDDVTNDECLAMRLHQEEMGRMEREKRQKAVEKQWQQMEDERVARQLQGQEQKPHPSNSSSIASPQSPPPDSHPFNPASNPQHLRQQTSPVDVTQSLPSNPSAGSRALNQQQQQRYVQVEQSLPPRATVDSGPSKQAGLNYKRAPTSTKKGSKSTKKK